MIPRSYSLGLIGYPLGHSLSPHLHAAALRASGFTGEYRLFPVPPLPDGTAELDNILARLRAGELHGLNVTIPHKQGIAVRVDELTPVAKAIGAVNTIFCREGWLVGENTDVAGFWADLQRAGLRENGRSPGRALVLGAGGGARAVAYALVQAGWTAVLWARSPKQAQALAAGMSRALGPAARVVAAGSPLASRINSEAVPVELQMRYDLIVNTTPLGMFPNIEGNPWPEGLDLPQGAAVYDLVYNPGVTALVRAAREAGLPAASGLGMLVEQAALAFERWTGQPAPRPAMWAAVGAVRPQHVVKARQ